MFSDVVIKGIENSGSQQDCPCKENVRKGIKNGIFLKLFEKGTEILLLHQGDDLDKLHSKIQNDWTGSHLLQVKSA